MDKVALVPDRVKAVSVLASSEALEFPAYVPRTPESARFSLPYLLAARIINGPITEDTFASSVINDPEILHLARRVSFEEAASDADAMSATVTVETSDTGTISARGSVAKSTQLVEAQSLIPEKAIRLMTPTLGAKRARQIVHRVTTDDESAPLRELTRLTKADGQD
jgi:2-methylcitrate dehydratase PrpD